MNLPKDFQKKVLEKLQEKKVKVICEACGENNWAVLNKPVGLPLTDLSGNIVIPSPQLPAAVLICNNCGYIRCFALGVLNI